MKEKLKKLFIIFLAAVMLLPCLAGTENYQALTLDDPDAYENAYKFYTEVDDKNKYGHHALFENHNVYYATRGKLAASKANKRFRTMGWTITVTSAGGTMSIEVGVGGNNLIQADTKDYGGYQYILWIMPFKNLSSICHEKNEALAKQIFNQPLLVLEMDAIMTTIDAGSSTPNAKFVSESAGEVKYDGTIYRLTDDAQYDAIQSQFYSSLDSYRNIRQPVDNYPIVVKYFVGQGTIINPQIPLSSVYNVTSDGYVGLKSTGKAMSITLREWERLYTLANTSFVKPGYHLENANAWKYNNGYFFNGGQTYYAIDIYPDIGESDEVKEIVLEATWEENQYTVRYEPGFDGEAGYEMYYKPKYSESITIDNCRFYRPGYVCTGWKVTLPYSGALIDESAANAQNGIIVPADGNHTGRYLTDVDNGVVTFTAQWEPVIYTITCDKGGGVGGTDAFYELFTAQFQAANAENQPAITKIDPPKWPNNGYVFKGYEYIGIPVTDENGNILDTITPYYFTSDETIHAVWDPVTVNLTVHYEGGTDNTGDTSITMPVTYHEAYPVFSPPVREGYTLKGFYTERNGNGDLWYNSMGACIKADKNKSELLQDAHIYAHWVDDTPPEVTISCDSEWSNKKEGIEIRCSGIDRGSGIKSLTLYQINDLGEKKEIKTWTYDTPVASTSLEDSYDEVYYHKTEGIFRYTVQAVDAAGNTSTALYNPVAVARYDITPPKIRILTDMTNYTINYKAFELEFEAWDYTE